MRQRDIKAEAERGREREAEAERERQRQRKRQRPSGRGFDIIRSLDGYFCRLQKSAPLRGQRRGQSGLSLTLSKAEHWQRWAEPSQNRR